MSRHILRQLPFKDQPTTVDVGAESVPIRAYQIVVWVSLSIHETADFRSFPAVLDTGHSHNFSIRENQLFLWAGLRLEEVPQLGTIRVNQDEIPLCQVHLWLHRNRPRTNDLLAKPFRVDVSQGIAVYPSGVPAAPRLPLIGLRGLVRSAMRLTIDGQGQTVSLRT